MNTKGNAQQIVGIVLAAGKGRRFDPVGAKNKLLQPLANGRSVAATTAMTMRLAVDTVIAVIPGGGEPLAAEFRQARCTVTRLSDSGQPMSASLVHAIHLANNADGWIIALADMPFVRRDTYEKLLSALASGAGIAVPVFNGVRGNPVAFAKKHGARLAQLSGDAGARDLLRTQCVVNVEVDDPGICQDIDTVTDYIVLSRAMASAAATRNPEDNSAARRSAASRSPN